MFYYYYVYVYNFPINFKQCIHMYQKLFEKILSLGDVRIFSIMYNVMYNKPIRGYSPIHSLKLSLDFMKS